MAFSPNIGAPTTERPVSRRRFGRVLCQDIECSLGQIIDLSASGMRVITRKSPPPADSEVQVTVESLEGPIAVPVRTAWIRKAGWGKREVGLMFGAMDDETRRALTALARASAYNETLRDFRNDNNLSR